MAVELQKISMRESYSSLFRIAAQLAHACEFEDSAARAETLQAWREWCHNHCVARMELGTRPSKEDLTALITAKFSE